MVLRNALPVAIGLALLHPLAAQTINAQVPGIGKTSFVSLGSGPLIGDLAPSFKAKTQGETIHFPDDYRGKWVILFSNPSDFSPVSETELKKLAGMMGEFDKLHAKLVAVSPDSKAMHKAWINEIEKSSGILGFGKTRIEFPIVADEEMTIAEKYGMVHPNDAPKQPIRSVFIIDPKGTVRAILHYPIGSGRNFDEVKRLLQSLQTTDGKKVATPAQWQPNKASTTSPLEKEYKGTNAQ